MRRVAQVEYQLPRLTRMWTHLDRVGGGGQVKGAGAACHQKAWAAQDVWRGSGQPAFAQATRDAKPDAAGIEQGESTERMQRWRCTVPHTKTGPAS